MENKQYFAYMLRLWQVSEGRPHRWRASLEDPRTGEQRGFANLNSLLKYLLRLTGEAVYPEVEEDEDNASNPELP